MKKSIKRCNKLALLKIGSPQFTFVVRGCLKYVVQMLVTTGNSNALATYYGTQRFVPVGNPRFR